MTEDDPQQFSEEAALRELENLHRAIEASRVRRKDANDAFETFLRSFDRRPAPASAPEPPPAAKPVPVPAAAPAVPAMPPAAPAPAPAAPIAPVPVPPAVRPAGDAAQPQHIVEQHIIERPPATVTPAIVEVPPAFPAERRLKQPDALDLDNWEQSSPTGVNAFPEESGKGHVVPAALAIPVRSSRRIPPVALAGAGVVIAAVAFFALRGTSDDTGRTDAAATETSAAAPQPASQPAPAPVAAPPPRAEIVTSRQVWIRVMVDGQKVLERELPPDTRIPLNPAAQFVVRAGDAGALRVMIDGKDQGPFGIDGRVATKLFAVPPKTRE